MTRAAQMNTPLFRERRIDLLRRVRPALHPLVWVDEGAALDDENASKMHNMIVVPSLALKVGYVRERERGRIGLGWDVPLTAGIDQLLYTFCQILIRQSRIWNTAQTCREKGSCRQLSVFQF